MPRTLREELLDRVRLYDQMCTMHSVMRDRSAARAKALELALLIVSGALVTFTFVGGDVTAYLGFTDIGARVAIGTASTAVFILSLTLSKVDWKAAAERHSRASRTLAESKARARSLITPDGRCSDTEIQEFLRESALIVGTLPEIPETQFLRLKAAHLRKVAISRALDRVHGAPLWLVRLTIARRHIGKLSKAIDEAQ